VGLRINEEKTKYKCINRQGNRDRIRQNNTIDTYNFERVERFKYLGATITADNDVTEEIKGRITSRKSMSVLPKSLLQIQKHLVNLKGESL